jgi:hypothetical protein
MDDILMPESFLSNRGIMYHLKSGWILRWINYSGSGVIQNDIPQEEFFGSIQEKHAWQNYQRLRYVGDHPIARSLYALQLEEWFAWLKEAGARSIGNLVHSRGKI